MKYIMSYFIEQHMHFVYTFGKQMITGASENRDVGISSLNLFCRVVFDDHVEEIQQQRESLNDYLHNISTCTFV